MLPGPCALTRWPGAEAGHVELLFAGAPMREGFERGWARYRPVGLFDAARLLAEGALAVDVACIQVTPPDTRGRCHLGLSVDLVPAALSRAPLVVAQMNPALPRVPGRGWVARDEIDRLTVVEEAPPVVPRRPPSGVERAIGEHVARLVPDGATLQLGLGGVMDAVASALSGRRGLGIHTGLLTDAVMGLVRGGAADGRRKGVDEGRAVATMVVGGKELHAWVHENPAVALEPVSHTHSPATLGALHRFVAVNSAFEIDLSGAVNAEAVGGRPAAGVGGQLDFVRGAASSPEGRSILALPSTGGRAGRSRIVARLAPPAPVTTPRSDAGWVVTEYGAADLRGATLEERAAALVSLAHPDHRSALRTVWEDAGTCA
jgi:4-hydroxybutyrate CoA-transferase